MSEAWKEARLGDFLRRRTERPSIDGDRLYDRLTVSVNGRGLRRRDRVLGAELGTARFVARSGDLIVSKIDARKGACGVLPESLNGAVVTGDFLTYEINPEYALAAFVDVMVRSEMFARLCDTISGGTTNRVRMDMSRFPDLHVPLPPTGVQIRIVDLMDAIDQALAALVSEEQALTHLVRVVRESFFSDAAHGADWVEFSALTSDARRSLPVEPDAPYRQIGVRSHGRGLFGKDAVTGEELGTKKMYTVHEGALIFNVVFAWEGAVAVVPGAFDGWASSHRFPTFRRVDGGSEEYLRQFFLSRAGLEALLLASPGGAGRNRTLGRSALGRIRIPRVDLSLEGAFVQAMTSLEETDSRLRRELSSLKMLRSNLLGALLSGSVLIDDAYDLDGDVGVSA